MNQSAAKGPQSATNLIVECGLPLIYPIAAPSPIEPAQSRLPAFLRAQVNSLTLFQKEAIVTCARSGTAWRMVSDEGKYLMGHDAAPAPLAFLSVGMVASFLNEILALAAQRNIAIGDIELVQDNFYTMRGSMRDGSMRAGVDDVRLEVRIDADASRNEVRQLVTDAIFASPLMGLMRGRLESLFSLHRNGQRIATGEALEIATVLPDAALQTSQFPPMAPGEWEGILKRIPARQQGTPAPVAGSSLQQEQDRRLNIRAECRLRADGIKQIDIHLINPQGSAFRFLSDESAADNGSGRAPGALAYVAAGIGFCFMTQFGRFAQMRKCDLESYRIIQDSYFSLGGASGGTGEAGQADPLETHVFLETAEDDAFAQMLLDVAERTCFLHTFCRTDLKVDLKVRALGPYRPSADGSD